MDRSKMQPIRSVKRAGAALFVGLVGCAFLLMAFLTRSVDMESAQTTKTLWILAGCVFVGAGAWILIGSSRAAVRNATIPLNWFLPTLKKRRPHESIVDNRMSAMIQTLLPRRLFSDRDTKQRGLIRNGLRCLGPSWLASPARRFVQLGCLIVFLSLFLAVCWPYGARPEASGRMSSGWRLIELDATDGSLWFEIDRVPEWVSEGVVSHLATEVTSSDEGQDSLPVVVHRAADSRVNLMPSGELSETQLDQLLTGVGTWVLHERPPGAWPSHYADHLATREWLPVDLFLVMDPLVSLSTAIASRSWIWSLTCGGIILAVCMLIPRGFCGYICPLGTLIDLFDGVVGRHVNVVRISTDGWWVHIKYYLLLAALLSAGAGVLVTGYVAAIPVVTRGLLFLLDPLQNGFARGWHLVPPMHAGHLLSILLFCGVFALGFFRPRFWCKYVCPTGAVFSLSNLFRFSERKVEASCIHCNKCVEVCPFDAIKLDFTTRETDCTLCQTCAGVCPTDAIKFVERWNAVDLKVAGDPPTGETAIGRRGFLSLAAGTAAAVAGAGSVVAATRTLNAAPESSKAHWPIRPPGSVPEREFLQMCIRCGECFKVCPNNVLQAEAFQQGLDGLWTPMVVPDWAGCDSSCNACGQVCPTGAIRALPMAEKKVARMGLAIVNEDTCLPFVNREACQLCVDECNAAGYRAIEFVVVHRQMGEDGFPIQGSGYLAPVVIAERCVGCGLCQTRCYGINVKTHQLLSQSAIVVEVGPGKEDRLLSGSYQQLREVEAVRRKQAADGNQSDGGYYVPNL